MPSSKLCSLVHSRFAKIIVALALAASVLLVLVPSSMAAPDTPSIEWSKTFQGLQANSVIQTSDGGYAIAGTAGSASTPTLIKTDSAGNLQWQKALGNIVSLAQTSDSGYVLFCENGDVVKTDVDGNAVSSFSVGLTGVRKGILTGDGSYILVGNSFGDGGEPYVWLRRVDAQGTLLWDKKFTGGFAVSSVIDTDDRGCALAGNWKTDFWLARLDSNGNLQWSETYTYGGTFDAHFVYSMTKTEDGGFMLAGAGDWQASGGMIPWLIKIDSQGHQQWIIQYSQYPGDSFTAIVQTTDQGFLLAQGGTASVMRTDSSGSELWKVPLGVASTRLVSDYPPSCLIPTKDGGYVIAIGNSGISFMVKLSSEADLQAPVVTISSPKSKTYETGDVPLNFAVNKQTSWLGYSLDGQETVTITGNTTLTGLSVGAHNLTVYAKDSAGLVGTSATIQFTVVAGFPTDIVIAGIAIAVAASVSFLLYVKRRNLSDFRKRGLKSFIKKPSLAAIGKNRLAWTLIIISLCFVLVFVQVFFPYAYYSVAPRSSSTPFEVGVSYVYENDNVGDIYSQVSHIKDLGFSVIRINLICDSASPSGYKNTLSDAFFSAVRQLNVKVALIIKDNNSPEDINFYLDKWGKDLTYIQILNEPDVASSWDMGALFTDDEAGSKFQEINAIVEQHQLPALQYTNFSPAFVVRTNLPIQFSKQLDFVGYDVFMDSLLTISPNMVQLLHKITNKDVVIAEFGMSSSDDVAQSDYILRGLNLFKNMGLRGCWLVYWNSVDNNYGIQGRLAEQKVGEWIAANT